MCLNVLSGSVLLKISCLIFLLTTHVSHAQEIADDQVPVLPGVTSLTRQGARDIVRDATDIVSPNGIIDEDFVEIGGIEQWVSVRTKDAGNPVLLFIHGGPGSTEAPVSWLYQNAWEDYFTVVQWDQRGAGKTLAANAIEDLPQTVSIERMVTDGLELVAYLREKFQRQKIYVLGHSWGTVIGLEIAQRKPSWLHAYIGMGQAINFRENEALGYNFALQNAKEENNKAAIKELEQIAPYPPEVDRVPIQSIVVQRKWLMYYGGMTFGRKDLSYEINAKLLSPTYTDADIEADQFAGIALVKLMQELENLDYKTVTKIECPVFILAGQHDYATSTQLAKEWIDNLDAPYKKFIYYDNVAHMIQLEAPGRLLVHLVNDVLPLSAVN